MRNYLRKLLPGNYYHIYNHGNGSETLFRTDHNYRFFLKRYDKYVYPIAYTHAYCLMPNHFHILLQFKNKPEIKRNSKVNSKISSRKLVQVFSNFFNCYSRYYNDSFDRKGKLFQLSFKRIAISDSEHFENTFHYIHWNPVKHGYSDAPREWKYSSIHEYDQTSKQTLVKSNEIQNGTHEITPNKERINFSYFDNVPY